MANDQDPVARSAGNLGRAQLAAVIVGIPVVVLVWIGAPVWLSIGFLVALATVLGVIALRARHRHRTN
jgi:Flp pilus assembly protein TadB